MNLKRLLARIIGYGRGPQPTKEIWYYDGLYMSMNLSDDGEPVPAYKWSCISPNGEISTYEKAKWSYLRETIGREE